MLKNELKKLLLTAACGFLFAAVFPVTGQEKIIKKCKSTEKKGKYELVSEGRLLDTQRTIHAIIVVKPKYFTREYMMQVARRLRSTYCNVERVSVSIFDDGKLVSDHIISGLEDFARGRPTRVRGYYSFDNAIGKEQISFSTKRGNSISEITVDLTKDP